MSDLAHLIDDFLANEFETSPISASALGLTDYDELLDDLSADAFERRDADAARFLARFEAVPDDGLHIDEKIDRDLAVAMLRGRLIAADWQGWKRDPLVYSGPLLGSLFNLFLHRLRPNPDLVDAAIARMEQFGRALEQGMANLDPALAHPLIAERGLNSARGGARYVRELLVDEAETDLGRTGKPAAGRGGRAGIDAWIR
jgi:uncharacterized protein (DUF885 family)